MREHGDQVLNLCFHGIGTPGRVLETDEDQYWIQPGQFDDLLSVISRFPNVRITFDDGNASDAAIALPALRKHNRSATFFVISDRIDQPGSLSSADVRELVKQGMTVGSHGKRHVPWRSASDAELRDELVGSATAISAASGAPVLEAACPFGSYDRRVLHAVRSSGFSRVYTVDGGPARSTAWLQPRYTVMSDDTPAGIERRARQPRGLPLHAAVRSGKSLVKQWR